jgi:hypothetical protein
LPVFAIFVSYRIDIITMNKLVQVLLDTPRLSSATVIPRAFRDHLTTRSGLLWAVETQDYFSK